MTANSSNSGRVDFVGDMYPQQGIEDLEREKRSGGETYLTKNYGTQQRVHTNGRNFCLLGEIRKNRLTFCLKNGKDLVPKC